MRPRSYGGGRPLDPHDDAKERALKPRRGIVVCRILRGLLLGLTAGGSAPANPPIAAMRPAPAAETAWTDAQTLPPPTRDPWALDGPAESGEEIFFEHSPTERAATARGACGLHGEECWQCLPDGLLYRSYLAGAKEPRFAGVVTHIDGEGWFLDAALGGRVGLLRYGSTDRERPQGWQLDLEGAAFPLLDLDDKWDVVATDFRIGFPLTYASGGWEYKLAIYHLSSHLGDEFMLKHPAVERINYSRDVLVLGGAYRPLEAVRLYAEAGWAFNRDGGSEPLEFQSGIDFSPTWHAPDGAPFAAFNAHLREDVDFGGHVTLQAGWQWRGDESGHLMRLGLEYLNGKSPQFEFFTRYEERLGLGLWYDY